MKILMRSAIFQQTAADVDKHTQIHTPPAVSCDTATLVIPVPNAAPVLIEFVRSQLNTRPMRLREPAGRYDVSGFSL
ncbi:hypothetical protein MHM97_17575 [Epibacterium sp. Ofav1-8]|nr:hypothetical protein [Epibacterium sp. Ofav1-8]